jgi:hypothetical protein
MRAVRDVVIVLLGVALPYWVSASIPQATIQRNSGSAVIGLAAALVVVIAIENRSRLTWRFRSPLYRPSVRPSPGYPEAPSARSGPTRAGVRRQLAAMANAADSPRENVPRLSGPEQLPADLAVNLQAVPEFKAEYDKIMPPPGSANSQEVDAVDVTLYRLAAERLSDIPLRPYEVLIVGHILRDAIQSLDSLPFTGMQPGNEATDIQSTGKRRQDITGGEQMWHLPTTYKGFGNGTILSDQTLETLTDLHRRLMKLRREAYDKYHPPTMPVASQAGRQIEAKPKVIGQEQEWGYARAINGRLEVAFVSASVTVRGLAIDEGLVSLTCDLYRDGQMVLSLPVDNAEWLRHAKGPTVSRDVMFHRTFGETERSITPHATAGDELEPRIRAQYSIDRSIEIFVLPKIRVRGPYQGSGT